MVELKMRPTIPRAELREFKYACMRHGYSMSAVVRMVVSKIAAGDEDLLRRIYT
jgi:hypothetical protein